MMYTALASDIVMRYIVRAVPFSKVEGSNGGNFDPPSPNSEHSEYPPPTKKKKKNSPPSHSEYSGTPLTTSSELSLPPSPSPEF